MRGITIALVTIFLVMACRKQKNQPVLENMAEQDSLFLAKMISEREVAMITKNMGLAMDQFSENATWINSQGYFFEGKDEVEKFHGMLSGNDSLDYYYEAGIPRIQVLDAKNAIAYYSWKMFWYRKQIPTDTTFKEIGLMTLHAQKQQGVWKWCAVTNQHTPWFYEEIRPVKIE